MPTPAKAPDRLKPLTAAIALLLLLSLTPAASPQSPPGRDAPVATAYDKFEDRTSVSADIRPTKVSDTSSDSTLLPIPLSAEFTCQGRSVKCPAASVFFAYPAGPRSLARCDQLDVIFLADGVRFKAGECHWGGSVVTFALAATDFVALSKASHVEAKVGLWIFAFGDEALRVMRSLAEHLEVAEQPGGAKSAT